MIEILLAIVFALYLVPTVGLLVYGLNCYVMLGLYARRRKQAGRARCEMRERFGDILNDPRLPVVTTQIAVYNEVNVVERIMRAACRMAYPAGKHEIQVLDDSTDETRPLIDCVAAELRESGHDVRVVRRSNRDGYKAGALAEGLKQARGEFAAVFDADFVPPEDYLVSTVPFFIENPRLGFVQTRWGHLNAGHSLLTRAQSIGIDGHFIVEQIARNWNGLYMNFNGTAGVWRAKAIEAAGGWSADTLTEDLDLSYRVQFAGWETLYLPDVVVPAELPENVNAFRVQQFRWAKGSFQTLLKLFPRIMRAPVKPFRKLQAVLHISGYMVHPLMLGLSLMTLPLLALLSRLQPPSLVFTLLALPICLSLLAPSSMYVVSQKSAYGKGGRWVAMLPVLIIVGVGLALSNSRAIAEAVLGRKSEFVRTPKRGHRMVKAYRLRVPRIAAGEILLGLYSAVAAAAYLQAGHYLAIPFIVVYAAGFLFIGGLTFYHSLVSSG